MDQFLYKHGSLPRDGALILVGRDIMAECGNLPASDLEGVDLTIANSVRLFGDIEGIIIIPNVK